MGVFLLSKLMTGQENFHCNGPPKTTPNKLLLWHYERL